MGILLSFDIWDTVLRRQCHPDEIKLFTARYLYLRYHRCLRSTYPSVWDILRERMRCEGDLGRQEAEKGNDDEYTIEGVFTEWIGRVFIPEFPLADIPELVEELVDLEVRHEIAMTYVDDKVRLLLRDAHGSTLAFISDFYMGADLLTRILQHHCGEVVDRRHIFVSSDYWLNKRSGRLFETVHATLSIPPENHLHVGDNYASDVAVPARLGMRSAHFRNRKEEKKKKTNNACFARREQAFQPYIRLLTRELRKRCPAPSSGGRTPRRLFGLGRELSVLFCGYVLFAIEQGIKAGVDTIYYFTREGEFLRKIHDVMRTSSPLGVDIPESEIVEISRLASFLPSMRKITTNELMRVWNLYSTQSIQALFRTLDIDPRPFAHLLQHYGIPLEEEIQYPWLDDRVVKLFDNQEFVSRIGDMRFSRRTLILDYLASKKITPDLEKLFIADIGWRGTIQDNLAYLLPDTQIHGCYLGLVKFLNEQPPNVIKHAFGPNENVDGPLVATSIKFVPPLEMVANSPAGSVIRYKQDKGKVGAIREVNPAENHVYEAYTRHFQAGVLASIEVISDWVKRHSVTAAELRPHALNLLSMLTKNPPRIFATAFFSLSHNETFGVGRYLHKNTRFPLALAASGVLSKERAKKFLTYIEETGWPQGFLTYYRLHVLRRLYNRFIESKAAGV